MIINIDAIQTYNHSHQSPHMTIRTIDQWTQYKFAMDPMYYSHPYKNGNKLSPQLQIWLPDWERSVRTSYGVWQYWSYE